MYSRRAACAFLFFLCTVRFSLSAPIVLLGYEDDRIIHLIRALKEQFARSRFIEPEVPPFDQTADRSAGPLLDDVRLQKRPFLVGMGPYWRPPKQSAFKKDSA